MTDFSLSLPLFQASGAAGGSGSLLTTVLMFGAIFVIFYFLIIRPQNKKRKEMAKMLSSIKKGDKVITSSGIHATVFTVHESTVILKVDESTKMEFSKGAITTIEPKATEEKTPAIEKADSSEPVQKEAEDKK